jgi:hypothetical protein
MEGPKLILSDLFGDGRPSPGPLAENLSLVEHRDTNRLEPTAQHGSKVGEGESPTLARFLEPPRDGYVAPPSVDEAGVDDVWQVRDLLPPLSPPSPIAGRSRTKATIAELARLLAPAVALLSLRKGSGIITVREAWAAVPEPKPRYDGHNSIGDALGHGRGGHALQLRRGPRRAILICQENVNACMRRMTDAEVRSLAEQLGCASRDELLTTFDNLPLADESADS